MRTRRFRLLAPLLAIVLLLTLGTCASPPYTAYPLSSTTLTLTLPNDPYLLVDSNDPASGPQVAVAYATVSNTGTAIAHDVYMYIGNGITPGTFAPGSDGDSLSMLGGATDATRFILNLAPGESKTVYWMLTYPLTDGKTYPLIIWADSVEGDFVQGSHTYTTRSTISAQADKILGTITVDPPSAIVNVGNMLTVTVTDFDFGQIGSIGDAWLQPVGNADFNPACFRLVKSEVYIHSLAGQCGYPSMPAYDRLYFPGIRTCYSSNAADYIKYYFVALEEAVTTMKVYQKAASGAVEKYSADYGVAAATLTTTSLAGSVALEKSVTPSSGAANTTFTWTITYSNNSDYPVGDPENGNGLVLIDEAVPANTTYVAGSATCSGTCVMYYSTDSGATWNQTEPVPASSVNKLKWYIDQIVPAHSSGTVSFQSKVDSGVPGNPVICNSASAQIDDGASLGATGVCANGGVDLELTKLVDQSVPCEDSRVTYTITVTNPSTTNATNVQVTDLLPSGLTYDSSVPSQGSYNHVSGLWTVGAVNAGAAAVLLLTATVDAGTGGQIIANTGNITHVDQTDSLVTNNSDHADIFVPSSVATASSNSPVCEGSPIFLTGGPSGITSYNWTGPNGFINSSQSPTILNATSLNAGTYYLTVTNGGCVGDPASTEVVVNPKPMVDAGADREIIAGGSVVIGGSPTVLDGTPPYTYSWSPTTGLNDTSIANPTASPAVNTTYNVTVIDSNGCTDSDFMTVTVTQGWCICGFVHRAGTSEALAGWGVILEQHTNPWVEAGSTTTDANGKYCFCGLGDGEYRVSEVVQPDWIQVSPLPNEHLVTLPGGASDPVLGPFFNFENEQGPVGPLTVGWEAISIDKLAVLAPWIVLFAVIVAGAGLLVLRRRRA